MTMAAKQISFSHIESAPELAKLLNVARYKYALLYKCYFTLDDLHRRWVHLPSIAAQRTTWPFGRSEVRRAPTGMVSWSIRTFLSHVGGLGSQTHLLN
jgi:hypothetical protein